MRRDLGISLGISLVFLLALLTTFRWVGRGPGEDAAASPGSPSGPPTSPAERGWRVTGFVLKREVGGRVLPAPGVAVRAVRETAGDEQASRETATRTRSDGRFELTGVAAAAAVRIEIDDGRSAIETISLGLPELEGAGREDLGVRLLRPGETMTIRALRADGAPIERARIQVRHVGYVPATDPYHLFREGGREAREVGRGEYRLERLAGGRYRIIASAPGFTRTFFNVEFPRADPIDLHLKPGGTISGVVVTGEGRPIEGAEVVVLDYARKARTDAAGRFTLDDLWDGEFPVAAGADGFEDDFRDQVPEGTSDLRLVLTPTNGFSGRVVAEDDGSPVVDAEVSISGMSLLPSVRTDSRGFYWLKRLPHRARSIRVRHEAFLSRESELSSFHDREQVIRLERGSTISGKVFDSGTRAPIPDATVTAWLPEKRKSSFPKHTRTGTDGSFKVPALEAGSWTVEVKRRGYRAAARQYALDGTGREEVSLFLERGRSMDGRVLDPTGNPVPAARVTPALAASPNGKEGSGILWEQAVFTAPDGSFQVEGLPAGASLCLLAEHLEFNPGWLEEVHPGDQQAPDAIQIRLGKGGTIEGRVLDEKGEGVTSARVFVEGGSRWPESFGRDRRPRPQANVDGVGRYSLRWLPPGSYRIHARVSGLARGVREEVRVEERGTTAGVDVVLSPGETITGRVLDSAGAPVAGARVLLRVDGDGPWKLQSTTTDGKGLFRLAGLLPGQCEILVRAADGWGKVSLAAPAEEVTVRLQKLER